MTDIIADEKVYLYKCPYCASRFTKEDGWTTATRHIREKHNRDRDRNNRGKRNPEWSSSWGSNNVAADPRAQNTYFDGATNKVHKKYLA